MIVLFQQGGNHSILVIFKANIASAGNVIINDLVMLPQRVYIITMYVLKRVDSISKKDNYPIDCYSSTDLANSAEYNRCRRTLYLALLYRSLLSSKTYLFKEESVHDVQRGLVDSFVDMELKCLDHVQTIQLVNHYAEFVNLTRFVCSLQRN